MCSTHLAFPICILSASMWCIHIVVLTPPKIEKVPFFFSSDWVGFRMIDNLSIAVHTFARLTLTWFSVNKLFPPRYVNMSTNSRGLSLRVDMAPSRLKHMNSVIYAFTKRLIPPADCSTLCNYNSAWNVRSSAWSVTVRISYAFCLFFLFSCKAFFLLDLSTFEVLNLGRL